MHSASNNHFFYNLLHSHPSSFLAKTFATVDPGAKYLPNWHIDLIVEYLEAARRGEIQRLIINMPPRALKSISVSVAWPAWLLGHNPSARIIAASYSAPLAIKHSIDCRMVMQSPWYAHVFPGTQLAHDQNEKHKFMTSSRGYRFATSVGGTLTGEGGNFLIIDDPINPEQAENKLLREGVQRWFSSTFSSRLDDKARGVMVLVMQRLHQDDLSGYLLERGGWEHLCLPAIAEEPKTYSYGELQYTMQEGEPLHQSREDVALVERARREMGSHAFAAQYQQNPLPEEGAFVKHWWLRRYDTPPGYMQDTPGGYIVQSWDTAIKSGPKHDASVCLTFLETQDGCYLLDALAVRAEYPELKRLVLSQAEKYKPHAILIEDKASGQQLLQDFKRDSKLPVLAQKPHGDKITRLAAVSALIESGRLLLPREAHWLSAFEHELLHFPNTAHDDYVDALTQYLDWVRAKGGGNPNMRPM